jgi:hypothetical protein
VARARVHRRGRGVGLRLARVQEVSLDCSFTLHGGDSTTVYIPRSTKTKPKKESKFPTTTTTTSTTTTPTASNPVQGGEPAAKHPAVHRLPPAGARPAGEGRYRRLLLLRQSERKDARRHQRHRRRRRPRALHSQQAERRVAAVGLYELNPVVTHSLKAPSFNP